MQGKIKGKIIDGLVKEKGWTGNDGTAALYSSNYCEGKVEWSANGLKVSFSLSTRKLECLSDVLEHEEEVRNGLLRHMHKRMTEEVKKVFPADSVTGINSRVDGFYFEAITDDPPILWCIIRLQLRYDRVITIALEKDYELQVKVSYDFEDVLKKIVNENIFGDGE